MTKEELERLYIDIYDNGIPDYGYKEKFKRYVNNRLESLEKENAQLKEANQTLATMNESMWVELEMKRAESQGIMNRLHQLAKANKIIKILKDSLSMYSGAYQKEIAEAEHFLEEVDK